MDKNLNYQRARRIRGAGFSSIFADQMLYEQTILGAAQRTLSLKLQSKMKGFQEKFDPLNMARMLTFGSKIGPSILGKMTGRSKEDIEYFTGRLKPIAVRTGGKVTPVPKEGEQLVEGKNIRIGGTNGINQQLLRIYKLLKKSKDSDKTRRELEMSFAEEKQLESDRRHKELLKSLEKLTASIGATAQGVPAQEESEPSAIAQKIGDFVEERVATQLASLFAPGMVGATAVITALLSPFVMAAYEKSKIRENPNAPEYKDNPYAMVLRGEAKSENEAAQKNINKTIKQFRRNDVNDFVKSDLTDKELVRELGADRATLSKWLQDNTDRSALWQAPSERTPDTLQRLGIEESKAGAGRGAGAGSSNAQMADYLSRTMEDKAAFGVKPHGIKSVTDTAQPMASNISTEKLNAMITENVDAKLPKQDAQENLVVNSVNKSIKSPSRPVDRLSELSVRNDEPTLLRMIMGSTKII